MKNLKLFLKDRNKSFVEIPKFSSKEDMIKFFKSFKKDNEDTVNFFAKVKDTNCYITYDAEEGFSDYVIININDDNKAPIGRKLRPNKSLRDDKKLFFKLKDDKMDDMFMSDKDRAKLIEDFDSFLGVKFELPIIGEKEMMRVINDCIESFKKLEAKWKLIKGNKS